MSRVVRALPTFGESATRGRVVRVCKGQPLGRGHDGAMTGKGSDSTRARLRDALESQDLVWVKRTGRGWDRRGGYVLQVGSSWMLMATPDDRVRPDGYSLLRVKDVASVSRGKSQDRLFRRSLEMHGEWPPQPPAADVNLTTVGDLVRSLCVQFPLISLFTEEIRPTVCFIGSVIKVTDRSLYMIDVTTQGEWEPQVTRRKLRDITRIDVGGGYERALAEVAGSTPTL
jgi:hypothetical protein